MSQSATQSNKSFRSYRYHRRGQQKTDRHRPKNRFSHLEGLKKWIFDEAVWKNFMTLANARPDCLVSSSGADYKAWSGTGQKCNVFVRSADSQPRQPLLRGCLATNWWPVNKVLVEKPF